MRRLNTILLALGLAFFVYLVLRVGPGELWRQFMALGWGITLLILVEGAANLAHTAAWRHCIGRLHGRIPLWRLFCMNMAGFAINYLTPTASVGGELSRASLLASTHKGAEAASSVLLDKLMTAVAHLALVVLGALFLFWRVTLPIQLWVAMAVTTLLMTVGITVFLWLQKHGKLSSFFRWLLGRHLCRPAAQKTVYQISKVDDALKRFYREHPRDLVLCFAWHFVGHSAALVHAGVFLWLVKQPAPLATVAAAGFLSLWFDLLTFAIPLNLGTLEGSRILVLKALGCQALLGMTFGIAIRIAQLFWACFGLVSFALSTSRKSSLAPNRSGEPVPPIARDAEPAD